MTLPSTPRRAGPFNGNGVTTVFPFDFKLFDEADLEVFRVDVDGVESVLVLNSDYSVTLNVDQDVTPGGQILYPIVGLPLPVGETLTAISSIPYDQVTDLPTGGAYRAQVVENTFDRIVMQIQQLAELANRAVVMPPSTEPDVSGQLPPPEAFHVLGWNEAEDALVNYAPSDFVSIVASGTAVADIFSGDGVTTAFSLSGNPGSLANLDVSIDGDTQRPGIDYFWSGGTNLVFSTAPVAGTDNILVRYVQALPQVDTSGGHVNVADFGADMTGATDSTFALQAALDTLKSVLIPHGTLFFGSSVFFRADGQVIYGNGYDSVLKSAVGAVYIYSDGHSNIGLRSLKLDASAGTAGGFYIHGGSKNVTVSDIYFFKGDQRVWLYDCENVKVVGNTFQETGYGVLQEATFVSNGVVIDGNVAFDMLLDFVEANCTLAAPSFGWVVSNNVYNGAKNWPTPSAGEVRFVGFTSVNGVVISNNAVFKSCGDAAIHLEDTLGETVVEGNVFDDIITTGGNDGYVYLLNSAENTVIANNIFLRTEPTLPGAAAVSCNNGYTNSFQFTGNRVVGTSATGNMNGLTISFFPGSALVANNTFEKLNSVVTPGGALNISMVGNRFEGCNNPIVKLVSTIPATTDWLLADNVFRNTVGTHDVSITPNGSGTEGPKRWLVQGNKFSKAVLFQGLNPATTGEAQDILVINNQFGPAATLTLGGDALVRCRESQNQFAANGAYVGSFSRVESDTSVRAGVATQRGYWNNGPIVVVVDGLSGLDGGNWRQIALMIVATGIRPDFSGEFSIAGMVAIKGSVVWGDGGVVITNIAGVVSAAVSAATATSLTLTLNLPAAPSRNSALVSLISFAPGNLA